MRDSYRRPENGLLFFEKNGSKSAPYLYKNCRGEYNQFCKEGNFFKRKRLPLGQKYVFSRDNQKIFFKGKRFPLEQKTTKTSKGIEKCLSRGSGFLLSATVKFDVELEAFFKGKRFPLEQKTTKTSKEIEGYLSKGNGFLLVKTKQFRRHFRKKIQVETASS